MVKGTQIAPLGYYTFGGAEPGEGEEEEEPEEAAGGEAKTNYKANPKYDPPPLRDLLDTSMSFWVHTEAYILPQGKELIINYTKTCTIRGLVLSNLQDYLLLHNSF